MIANIVLNPYALSWIVVFPLAWTFSGRIVVSLFSWRLIQSFSLTFNDCTYWWRLDWLVWWNWTNLCNRPLHNRCFRFYWYHAYQSIHPRISLFSSMVKTNSPTFKFSPFLAHFGRCCNRVKYSDFHIAQKSCNNRCVSCHRDNVLWFIRSRCGGVTKAYQLKNIPAWVLRSRSGHQISGIMVLSLNKPRSVPRL